MTRWRLGLGALGVVALAAAGGFAAVIESGVTSGTRQQPVAGRGRPARHRAISSPSRKSADAFAVGERVITFVDHSRTVKYPGRPPAARTLVTVIRYPSVGRPGELDLHDASADRAAGPYPLIVFGHGFATTPAAYYRLLRAWAAAGFVVAAPVFPGENAHAPGGPDESDIVNQPGDMSFVITRMLRLSAASQGPLAGLIDPSEIAVAGQSDGGESALAVAYDRGYLDTRVRAAVILSGARIPSAAALRFGSDQPALLAAQGTADTTDPPSNTYAFFALAHRPKFLLTLLGAQHLTPYTVRQPQLGVVERVSVAFLGRYLQQRSDGIGLMQRYGDVPGIAALSADP